MTEPAAPIPREVGDLPTRAVEVRQGVFSALGCALAVPVLGVAVAYTEWAVLGLLIPVAWLGQIVLGFIGFARGRRVVREVEQLGLPVDSKVARFCKRWSVGGLVVAVFGLLGGLAMVAFIALLGAALGAMGGAWGRPLRVGGKEIGARLGQGRRWAEGPRPRVEGLDATTRRALGSMWLHDATKEHGSVPAFAQVSWQLAALGAPAALLERCQDAARQEIEHAKRCFAVAEAYLDLPIGVGPVPDMAHRPASGRRRALARTLALETLEDGCLIEDLNADFAERAFAEADDPAQRELTSMIARDEREHAELAWDILAFCIALDPTVAAAVRRRLTRLPTDILVPYEPRVLADLAAADPSALRAHGRVPLEAWPALYVRRRAKTIARAEALLAAAPRLASAPMRA